MSEAWKKALISELKGTDWRVDRDEPMACWGETEIRFASSDDSGRVTVAHDDTVLAEIETTKAPEIDESRQSIRMALDKASLRVKAAAQALSLTSAWGL